MRPFWKQHQLSKQVVIPNGTTTSGAIDTEGYPFMGLVFGTMTGTAMTFQVAPDINGTYVVLNDDVGNAVSITIASSKAIGLPSSIQARIAPFRFIKLVSGSAEGADRTINVVLKS